MRVVIGVVFIAIIVGGLTLMTAVIFLTQHPFASVAVAGLTGAAVVNIVGRRKARCSPAGIGYPDDLPARTAAQMSSAAILPRRPMPPVPAWRVS